MKEFAIVVALLLTSCAQKKAEIPIYGSVPDFTLTSQASRSVNRQELTGKVWIADFIFTECGGVCPLMTEKMKKLQDTLPSEIHFISFSVDPDHDTPEVLAKYATDHGADFQRWAFLTGSKDAMFRISREGFKLALDDTGGTPSEPITHSTRMALVDRQGRIRGYYGMEDADSFDRLIEDAKALLHT